MGTIYVEGAPTVEPHHGLFLVTLDSCGEPVKLLVTRSAIQLLGYRCSRAALEASETDTNNVVSIRKNRHAKREG